MALATQVTFSSGSSVKSCLCCCWKASLLAYYHIICDLCNLKRSKSGGGGQSQHQLSSHTQTSLVPAGRCLQSPPQAHETLPVWPGSTDPCSRLSTVELLHTATLVLGQTGTQEQVGSHCPAGWKAFFWPHTVFLWVGKRTGRPHSNVSRQELF